MLKMWRCKLYIEEQWDKTNPSFKRGITVFHHVCFSCVSNLMLYDSLSNIGNVMCLTKKRKKKENFSYQLLLYKISWDTIVYRIHGMYPSTRLVRCHSFLLNTQALFSIQTFSFVVTGDYWGLHGCCDLRAVFCWEVHCNL